MAFTVVVDPARRLLWEYLRRHFQEPEIIVVMDRRLGERRRARTSVTAERRHVDRRAGPGDDDPFWRYGFRVVPGGVTVPLAVS